MTNEQETGSFIADLDKVLGDMRELLIAKNQAYGDSALNPVKIYSKLDSMEQINVRIDDKLSRIMRGSEYVNDDTDKDLLGYLILRRIQHDRILRGYNHY
jgi:hypothetical protein